MMAFVMFAALDVLLPGAVAFNVAFMAAAAGAVASIAALLPVVAWGWFTGQGFNRPAVAGLGRTDRNVAGGTAATLRGVRGNSENAGRV